MSISHLLEDFGSYAQGDSIALTDVFLEEQRLEAFEKGYQAGWDDAVKAQTEDSRHISADMAQNLLDLSFTYQEARSAILDSLAPVLRQMVEVVLPRMARDFLPDRIAEEVTALASELGDHPVQITACSADTPALEALFCRDLPMTVQIETDDTMTDGQLRLQLGQTEREIDLNAVLSGVERAISDFIDSNQKETA